MADDNLISHTIHIAGQSYPVRLTEDEKILAQIIEKELNEKINEYRIKYTVDNTQSILSMLLITYAFELKGSDQNISLRGADEKINKLIELVSEQINS